MTASTDLRWRIRYAQQHDMAEILQINRLSFAPATEVGYFKHAMSSPEYTLMLADLDGTGAGYALFSRLPDCFRLEQVAVDPIYRRVGVGTSLVDYLIGRLKGHRRKTIEATVSEWNMSGQLFLRACGFRAVKVLRDFVDLDHDGYRFERGMG